MSTSRSTPFPVSVRPRSGRRFAAVLALAATGLLPQAQAGEVYANVGLPGIGLGYAHPIDSRFTVRADFMTLGSRSKSTTEEGIRYDGRYKLQRLAVLGDWFPFGGSFRLTGGLSSNQYKVTLDATGENGSLTIGDRTYTTTAADGLKVEVKFPSVTPYLGIGWGHQSASGWRFGADIGALVGRAKVNATVRGALASEPDIQANLDKELAELRDGVGKVRAIPQLSVAIGYSF
ncbi:hypothetical protein ABIC99_000588 [Sphaerotilus sulfidivorans]|uniref:Outer membrane protein beta-barrel domain-containing protein n=1 Tax=Sphaerotilus sulfidivorans TaxID=639200 RepID=A0ABV2IJ41_9BURK|nr:hypothetical protein [Sphaerotilus sulfidivorans]GIX54119.1 hypothetical protein CQA4T8M7_33750 [Sphaerotilus natans]